MTEEELREKLENGDYGIYYIEVGESKNVYFGIDGSLGTKDINDLAKILNDFKEG